LKVLTGGIEKWFYAPLENFDVKIFKIFYKNKLFLPKVTGVSVSSVKRLWFLSLE